MMVTGKCAVPAVEDAEDVGPHATTAMVMATVAAAQM
jgi:hypothetical protein